MNEYLFMKKCKSYTNLETSKFTYMLKFTLSEDCQITHMDMHKLSLLFFSIMYSTTGSLGRIKVYEKPNLLNIEIMNV